MAHVNAWSWLAGFLLLSIAAVPAALAAVRLELSPDATDALIVGNAPRTVTAKVTGDAGDYELRAQYVDRYGQVTDAKPIPFRLNRTWTRKLPVPVDYYGPATCRVAVYAPQGDEPLARGQKMLIRPVPLPRLSARQRMNSPIGINTHAKAHWNTLAAFGIHWARDYSWGWLGFAKTLPLASNKTDFRRTYDAAEDAGITILPIMQQAFRTPDKMYFLDDTKAIADAYTRLSKHWPDLRYWELDNEADLKHRDQTSDGYRRWLQTYKAYIVAADEGLRAAGKGAKVCLNGEAGLHPERTRDLIESVGEHFGVVNYHYYCGTVAPEKTTHDINTGSESRLETHSFLDQMRILNRIAHDAGKESWLTEIAWAARSGPAVGDRLQSAYLGRIYMLGSWAGTDKTFWFWDRNMRGDGRFSSTGLIDDIDGALPAGAAMAAVSKFIATATYAGSIDVGPDRWCLVYRTAAGKWVVGAWAVDDEYDLPKPLAAAKEAYGMYGNPLRDRRLTAEPAYFALDALPADWDAQRSAAVLSPTTVNLHPDATETVEFALPAGAKLTWEDMPDGVTGETLTAKGDRQTASISAAATVPAGLYPVAAVVEGPGWTKRLRMGLKIRPAVAIDAVPYTPGKSSVITLTNRLPKPVEVVTATATGEVSPAKVALPAGKNAKVEFRAPAEAAGAVELTAKLANGAEHAYRIRPRTLTIPKAGTIALDGDLADWPTGGRLPIGSLKVTGNDKTFAPTMRLAWSDAGLYVAATIPVGEGFRSPPKPGQFWEWTSVELLLSSADLQTERGVDRRHHLWFVPQQKPDGAWRVYSGEWLKRPAGGGKGKTVYDDPRTQADMRYADGVVTMEILVPVDVLGKAPAAGATWPLTINTRIAAALSPRTIAAWPAGPGKGWEAWGRVTFGE